MARNIINEIILSKVKEIGVVKLINKFIPDKYLVITEDSSHYIEPLSGKILFGYEVENIFKINIKKKKQLKKLKYLHTYIKKIQPNTHYNFVISDVSHTKIKFDEYKSADENPTFQISCELNGFFQNRKMPVCQKDARPCGRCLDRGNDLGFYHIDDLYPCEFYQFLCQECHGNEFCDCETCLTHD
jgi:hypothetical protein